MTTFEATLREFLDMSEYETIGRKMQRDLARLCLEQHEALTYIGKYPGDPVHVHEAATKAARAFEEMGERDG